MNQQDGFKIILVTGVTGYVGGRLVPRLLETGYRIRILIRGSANRLDGRPWKDQVEIAIGDVLIPESLPPAMEGVDADLEGNLVALEVDDGGRRHVVRRVDLEMNGRTLRLNRNRRGRLRS